MPKKKTAVKRGTLKGTIRRAVGGVIGEAVKIGDILAGTAGPLVDAQGEMAEAGTERLIDKIDGKG